MMRFISLKKVNNTFKSESDPKIWTAVIPAAGRGSRLGYTKPKILYPIAGRPILDWLIDLLEPTCDQLIFILSPTGAPEVSPLLEQRLSGRFEVAIQDEPRGMADAIYKAVPKLSTLHTLIIWGDQVAIHPATIRNIIKIHQFNPTTKLTMPIVKRENPYVHYQTDKAKRFVRVLEKREGASMPPIGESDCGLFAFDTDRLQEVFELEIENGITKSQSTKEWNFLPMLPQFDREKDSVMGLRLTSIEETIGVNDSNEAAILEAYLRKRMTL
jgi:bifunctional UDP-N-acetylglucosamine pyrophosphorylase/glucosamine-1-phosphate N-acetyltransferase